MNAELGGLHRAVAQVNVFNEAAAGRIRFEAHRCVQIRAVEMAVLREHIPYPAGGFAAHRHATVAVLEIAILDDHILTRNIHPASVGITPGLDGDAIITIAESAI